MLTMFSSHMFNKSSTDGIDRDIVGRDNNGYLIYIYISRDMCDKIGATVGFFKGIHMGCYGKLWGS